MSKNKIVYIKYGELDKEVYTIKEICEMLDIEKAILQKACDEFSIQPKQNEDGKWGFPLGALTVLHYKMFHSYNEHKEKETARNSHGPWDD